MCTSVDLRSCGRFVLTPSEVFFFQPSLPDNFLLQFLVDNPEMKIIEDRVDQYFWSIHRDKDTDELASLFSSFIQQNDSFLSKKTPQEKAKTVFDLYRKAYFLILQTNTTFCQAFKKLKSLPFGLSLEFDNTVQTIVLAKIKSFHSIIPGLVLEKVYFLPRYSLKLDIFPDHFSDLSEPQINISTFLIFHQHHFTRSALHE